MSPAYSFLIRYVLVTGADQATREAIVGNDEFGATYDEATDRITSNGSSHMDVSEWQCLQKYNSFLHSLRMDYFVFSSDRPGFNPFLKFRLRCTA